MVLVPVLYNHYNPNTQQYFKYGECLLRNGTSTGLILLNTLIHNIRLARGNTHLARLFSRPGKHPPTAHLARLFSRPGKHPPTAHLVRLFSRPGKHPPTAHLRGYILARGNTH